MVHESCIIVPSGLLPVHSFDLYGPLIDSLILGEQSIRLFEQIARQEGISPEKAKEIIDNYRALLRGEPWATGEQKFGIMSALDGPLQKHPELQPDYKIALQVDGVAVLREILEAREGVLIFGSKLNEWIRWTLPDEMGKRINLYADRKTKPEAFQRVYDAEMVKNRRVVTHTADELPELEAAVKTGLFTGDKGRLILVNRNDQVSEDVARSKGIDSYINDLRTIGYSSLVKR